MPTDYVEDFEEVSGMTKDAWAKAHETAQPIETKVVVAPKDAKVKPATQAKVK